MGARETMRRSRACRGSSMLTMDSPNTCLTQPGGSGLVTPGSLENTLPPCDPSMVGSNLGVSCLPPQAHTGVLKF